MADLNNSDVSLKPKDTKSITKVSAFERAFAEPQNYDWGRYVVNAKADYEAIEKLVAYFDDWHWIPKENRKYVIFQFRQTLKTGWVKWHGFIDDDGDLHNGWNLYEDDHWREPGFKKVYIGTWDKHYFQHGHHREPMVDEYGYSRSTHDCNICNQLSQVQVTTAAKNSPDTNTEAEKNANNPS